MTAPNPTENWPKSHLLQIHAEAIRHGFVWVQPITEADAVSLRQRCYRIRRRSDKATATFIPPEYHLVTFGRWEDVDGGRVPVIYNARPDGVPLPGIHPASGEEIEALSTMPQRALPTPLLEGPAVPAVQLSPKDIQIEAEEIGSLVKRMKAAAAKKVN